MRHTRPVPACSPRPPRRFRPMQITFDPTLPAERALVRRLLRPVGPAELAGANPNRPPGGGRGGHGKPGGPPPEGPAVDPAAVRQGLEKVLALACGEFLSLAAAHVPPEEEFTVPDLAEKSGVAVETLLSKNRTLGHSCRVRGLRKRDYVTGHGGAPRRFSLPQWVHAAVTKRAERQADEQAGSEQAKQAA